MNSQQGRGRVGMKWLNLALIQKKMVEPGLALDLDKVAPCPVL